MPGWVAQQWLYFLNNMPGPLTTAQMADLDKTFDFTHTANAAIGRSWFLLVIRNHYQPGYAKLEAYLQTIGRRKLITPLYEELMKDAGRRRTGQACLCAGAARLPSRNGCGDRRHRDAKIRGRR